jgi:hypothetical protein
MPPALIYVRSFQVLRKRQGSRTTQSSSTTILDLTASLLPPSPSTSSSAASDEDDDASESETDDLLRETSLLLLRLAYGQAQTQLESIEQELVMLRMAPPSPPAPRAPPQADPEGRRLQRNAEQDDMWRLDAPRPQQNALLDPAGKVRVVVFVCRRC